MSRLPAVSLPTPAQLKEILAMGFTPPKEFADAACRLLMDSPEMMDVITKWQQTAKDEVSLATTGSIFTGGFLSGYLMAFALMKLGAN